MKKIALLLSCEHAGHDVPSVLDGKLSELFVNAGVVLTSHRGWDPGAQDAAQYLSARWHAPLFSTSTSRLVCDTNRSLRHPSLWSEFTQDLNHRDKKVILESCYFPHRDAINTAIHASIEKGLTVLHLAIHSFTPLWNGAVRNMDIGLLYDPKRPYEKLLAKMWQTELSQTPQNPSLRIRRNAPYTGVADGLPTSLRRQFSYNDYIGFEVEFNQALLNDASGEFPAAMLADTLDAARDQINFTL